MLTSFSRAALLRRALDDGLGVDLHGHSRHSDGAWTPRELVADAISQGVNVMALTDHDTVAGQAEALAAGVELGALVITGIEVTVRVGDRGYHLLCYDYDPTQPVWELVRESRQHGLPGYYRSILRQLREHGYAVRDEDVQAPDGGFVRNPINTAVVKAGAATEPRAAQAIVRSLPIAFPTELISTPIETFAELLPKDGALISIAHPAREERGVSNRLTEEDARWLRDTLPFVALEAYHPYHTPADVEHYRAMAMRLGLGTTCGSDAHGWHVKRPPIAHSPELCRDFLGRLLARW